MCVFACNLFCIQKAFTETRTIQFLHLKLCELQSLNGLYIPHLWTVCFPVLEHFPAGTHLSSTLYSISLFLRKPFRNHLTGVFKSWVIPLWTPLEVMLILLLKAAEGWSNLQEISRLFKNYVRPDSDVLACWKACWCSRKYLTLGHIRHYTANTCNSYSVLFCNEKRLWEEKKLRRGW